MTPLLCVGEPLEVRQAGGHLEYTLGQLDGGLAGLSAEQVAGLVIAYEPVWAIGTGEVATPAGRSGDLRGHPDPDFSGSRGRGGLALCVSCMAGQ